LDRNRAGKGWHSDEAKCSCSHRTELTEVDFLAGVVNPYTDEVMVITLNTDD